MGINIFTHNNPVIHQNNRAALYRRKRFSLSQKLCSSASGGNQKGKVSVKKRLWWADACLEDGDGAPPTDFPSARHSDDKKVDAAPVASFPARYSKDTKKQDVDESVMVKFHQSLDGKLKKAFDPDDIINPGKMIPERDCVQ